MFQGNTSYSSWCSLWRTWKIIRVISGSVGGSGWAARAGGGLTSAGVEALGVLGSGCGLGVDLSPILIGAALAGGGGGGSSGKTEILGAGGGEV